MSDYLSYMKRGTYEDGDCNTHLEGVECQSPDFDPADPSRLRSAETVHLKRVKNVSSGALTPGLLVTYANGYNRMRVDTLSTTGDHPAGWVDDHLPSAGVPDGKYFWIVTRGPTKMVSDGGSTLSDDNGGDFLVPSTSGKVKKQTAGPANETLTLVEVNTYVGRPKEDVTNQDGTVFVGFADLK
jgi:hypothetical protein